MRDMANIAVFLPRGGEAGPELTVLQLAAFIGVIFLGWDAFPSAVRRSGRS